MFERIAELAIRRARLVLVVAVVAVALMGAVGRKRVRPVEGGGYDDPASPSTKANQAIEAKFGGETNLVFLVRAPGSRLDAPDAERAGRALVADLRDDPNLENVVAYWDAKQPALRSEDGREAWCSPM